MTPFFKITYLVVFFGTIIMFFPLQFECGGMVLEESPGKLSEAIRLFLQGMGYGKFWLFMNIHFTKIVFL